MKRYLLYLLLAFFYLNSVEAQSHLPLRENPIKSEITMFTDSVNMIGALFLLKDSSISVSNSLVKEDYNNGNYEVAELYIDDINLIRSKRRVSPLQGALLGALVGMGVGALTARIVIGPPPYSSSSFAPGAEFAYAVYVPAGAVVGATTGAIIGGIKIKIPINGSMENYNSKKKKLGRYTVKYDGSPKY
jgi:hypothetical protein